MAQALAARKRKLRNNEMQLYSNVQAKEQRLDPSMYIQGLNNDKVMRLSTPVTSERTNSTSSSGFNNNQNRDYSGNQYNPSRVVVTDEMVKNSL